MPFDGFLEEHVVHLAAPDLALIDGLIAFYDGHPERWLQSEYTNDKDQRCGKGKLNELSGRPATNATVYSDQRRVDNHVIAAGRHILNDNRLVRFEEVNDRCTFLQFMAVLRRARETLVAPSLYI